MDISYYNVNDFIGWSKAEAFVQNLVLKNNFKSVLEIGAGANPTLSPEFIIANNLGYTSSDVDDSELKKADPVYTKLILDLSSEKFNHELKYDFIFSRMVGEHISNAKVFHENIFKILNNGGMSFHCFSTLYAVPFVINKILPDSISDLVLSKIDPRDKHQHGKFKAHYDWSRGPSGKMIERLNDIGYEIIKYAGYFGHNYYRRIPALRNIEKIKSKMLLKFPVPSLTAYAYFILKKH